MSTGVDCVLRVNGARMPDGSPGENELDPTALSGLTIEWGRETTVDQPDASVCSFDVLDEYGGAAFVGSLRTGLTVDVTASGSVFPDPTVSTITDPGFESAAVGTRPPATLSSNVTSYVVTDTRASTGTHSARIQADPDKQTRVIIPPAPFSSDPSAWDEIPSTGPGETWNVSIDVWALPSAQIQIVPILFDNPSGKQYTTRGPFVTVQGNGAWQTIATPYVVETPGQWIGVDVRIVEIGPDWFYTPGSWLDQINGPVLPEARAASAVRTNLCQNPKPTPGAIVGWSIGYNPIWSADGWATATSVGTSTPYIFSAMSSEAIAIGDVVTLSAKLRVNGSGVPNLRLSPHIRTGNVYLTNTAVAIPATPGEIIDFSVTWTATRVVDAGNLDLAMVSANGVGTVIAPAGWQMSMTDVLIERSSSKGTFFYGSTPDVPATVGVGGMDYAWLGAANNSASTATALEPIPYGGPSWLDYAAAFLDNVNVLAPAAGTVYEVLVFSGRITDMTAAWDDSVGAPVVHVTAVDFTADLDNARVGDEPWPVETMSARFNRVLTLAGLPITAQIDSGPGATPVSYQDVDSQPATEILKDLSQSVDGVLWSAVHSTTGPYLRVEDPRERTSLYRLELVDGIVIIVEAGSVDDAIDLSACDVLRDPVEWVQDVSDVSTRASVQWLEQTVDDKGKPSPTERTVTVIDADLETEYGIRTISVSTLLQAEADARDVADRILARTSIRDWRASGITIDDDDSLESPDAAAVTLLLQLLDGTRRIGQAIRLVDLPSWSPAGDDVPVFLEGGRYAYLGGSWTLDLTVSSAVSVGASLAWADVDPAWQWIQFDPGISWSDLYGVGASGAEERNANV